MDMANPLRGGMVGLEQMSSARQTRIDYDALPLESVLARIKNPEKSWSRVMVKSTETGISLHSPDMEGK